jgi:hypothetical protein
MHPKARNAGPGVERPASIALTSQGHRGTSGAARMCAEAVKPLLHPKSRVLGVLSGILRRTGKSLVLGPRRLW